MLQRFLWSRVPEPIEESAWRRAAKLALLILPLLATFNVATRFFVARRPELSLAAFDGYLALNLPAHAVAVVLCLMGLRRGRSARAWRAIMACLLSLAVWSSLTGVWLLGSVTSGFALAFVLVVVGAARIYFDRRMGLQILATALVLHIGIVVLEASGVVASQPLLLVDREPEYRDSGRLLMNGAWFLAIYGCVWGCASYVATRFRESEHALRELNRGLEGRVQAQVAQLERVGRLRRYLSPQVADRIIASEVDPVALRERRHITVMFADLRGFTQLVERVPADALADLLNHYFDEVTAIAFRHGGTIDKFIGDAVMVFFGAPEATGERDQAERCARAAVEIHRRVAELADDFAQRGAGGPLAVRIGIASGIATVGAFGTRHRADFTVVGAPVNRAARLEPLAPAGGTLVDEETRALVADLFECVPHGEVPLKGFQLPVRTYTLEMAPPAAVATP